MFRCVLALATLLAASVSASACASRPPVVRRAATETERAAVVECAAAIVAAAGFVVTERRPDLGRLSAASAPVANAVDVLTVTISKHPITEGLALLVEAATRHGEISGQPSANAGLARDRILRGCAYLVG